MIEIKELYCAYDRVNVLNGINLSIKKGRITAILGPNGSGKSTLIKSILGIVVPHSGDILVDGSSILGQWKYKGSIDYLPQIAKFPENLEFNELLSMMSDLRNGQTRASELIDMFNMQMHLDKKMGHFSGGMKQKANIILSMMFDNILLILDEPSSGLDPLSLLNFKSFINREQKAGKTIILSTHILSLVEDLSDDVIFMLDGKIYFHGSLQEIMNEYGEKNLEKTIAKILKNQLNVESSQI